jgi:hypothetical protein
MADFTLSWAEDEFPAARRYFEALEAAHDAAPDAPGAPTPSPVPVPAPPADPVLPNGATVVFHEDWKGTDRILTPAERDNHLGGRWSDGSNAPNAGLSVVHADDGSGALAAWVKNALDHNDGARAFMSMDTPQWNDLPALEGKTVYWLITAFLDDMPVVQAGAGKWLSIAQIKRKDSEVPAYCEVNVRGDRGFNELYLQLGGVSYYFPTPTALISNESFTFLLEVDLSRDPAVGGAWLSFRGGIVGAKGATLNPIDGGAAFALTAYGNNSETLRVAFREVTFAVD